MNAMQTSSRLLLLTVARLVLSPGQSLAHTPKGNQPPQQIEAPKPKEMISPDTAIAEAQRLSQQGKFDEAIGQLEALAAKQPDWKGLSHELGIVYYKKGDYLKAVASLKKALEENPSDNEAVQLTGLSY